MHAITTTRPNQLRSPNLKSYYLLIFILFLSGSYNKVAAQIIFQETFNEPNGSTTGSANGINWSSACPTCLAGDYWQVQSGVFEGRDTNGEATWTTDSPIDISNCTLIEISFNVQSVGTMEACGTGCNSADWVRFQYDIDGSGWLDPSNSYFCAGSCAGINVIADDEVPATTYTTGCIPVNGNGLNLKISVQCWAQSEFWRIDNVTVTCSSPEAGTSSSLSTCAAGNPVNLFGLLGGTPDAGGTWSGPSALTGGDLGTFDPATMNPGTYTYTVGTAPCQVTADVVVTVGNPDAGIDQTITLCATSSPSNLFDAIGGTPDNGGVWSGPSVLTGGDLGTFDPTTMNPGVYTYTVGSPPCDASADVTVTIENPDAGTNGNITLCVTSPSANLIDVLGGNPDSGGTWSGPSVLNGGDLGTINPATMNPGIYTYTVGTAPCQQSADVVVTINDPDAGTSESISVCTSSPNINLFSVLGGTPETGGVWSGPSALTGGDLGTFDPASMNAGVYTYTVGTPPCQVSADVTVSFEDPDAGTDVNVSLCDSDNPTNLFNLLGGTPETGGVWNGPSALTGGDLGTFDPASMNAGVYTYTVGTAPCEASATVIVNVLNNPDASFSESINQGCAPLLVTFTNLSQNATSFEWDFGNSNVVTVGNLSPQSETFSTSSNVMLVAFNTPACSDTAFLMINTINCGCTDPEAENYDPTAVEDDGSCIYDLTVVPVVICPNVFTPNNDNNNDLFFLNVTDALIVEFTILNRWGNVMYEANGIGNFPSWDGTDLGGNMAAEGTYFVKYKVTSIDEVTIVEGHSFVELQRD